MIVKGETGCGKSSRVPQYVLESWIKDASSQDSFCRIAVTQPRRIAAISLSNRVASERNEEVSYSRDSSCHIYTICIVAWTHCRLSSTSQIQLPTENRKDLVLHHRDFAQTFAKRSEFIQVQPYHIG